MRGLRANPLGAECLILQENSKLESKLKKYIKTIILFPVWLYYFFIFRAHQSHYEQMGSLKGTVTVDGKEHYLKIPCVRDHSFGKKILLL